MDDDDGEELGPLDKVWIGIAFTVGAAAWIAAAISIFEFARSYFNER